MQIQRDSMWNNSQPAAPRSLLFPIGVLATCLFLWPALITFDAGDWPSPEQYPNNSPPANACGMVGAWCAYHLTYFLGHGTYPLLLFATLTAFLRLVRGPVESFWERASGLALLVACSSATAHLIWGSASGALPVGSGGLAGYALGELLRESLDRTGTVIVLAAASVVALLFTTQGWVLKLPSTIGRIAQAASELPARCRIRFRIAPAPQPISATEGVTAEERVGLLSSKPIGPRRRIRARAVATTDQDEPVSDREPSEEPDGQARTTAHRRGGATQPDENRTTSSTRTEPTGTAKRLLRPIVKFLSPRELARAEPYPRQIENWRLPSPSLLEAPTFGFDKQQEVVVREQARVLEQTLEDFRLAAQVVEIDTGPVITMFELRLGAGIKVSQVATLTNDIARALRSQTVRVVAPIPGKNTVGIEVPNRRKEKVRLKELLMTSGKRASEMRLPLFLGKDAGGGPLVTDLADMPHLLIAGTTGSGKSVCLNTIILSLLMTKRPDHVKMILIDPKLVELSQFKGVPHLMCPIVTDMARAEKILEWATTKMEERYELLAEARVKNIAAYNDLGKEALYERLKPADAQEKASIAVHMPYIVIIIDELADLMMTAAREVEHHLCRLAQKSRAVGVHIIVATQRPEVKIVTGLIKSNMPCRICFRVASRLDSRIVLDQNGGEVLMGQGDMLFLPPGMHELIRAQGTFMDDAEVHAVLEDLASRAEPEFHPELMRIKSADSDDPSGMRDPLFEDAVRMVLESKRGSVSLLQRRLTIGYSRASRLIDQMGDAGIVGEYKSSQAREVLMTLAQWRKLQAHVAADSQRGYAADEEDDDENGDFERQS